VRGLGVAPSRAWCRRPRRAGRDPRPLARRRSARRITWASMPRSRSS